MVVSCGDAGERGRRTELDLGSRKSLDDHHVASTFGTEPKWAGFLGRRGFWFGLRWRCGSESLKAKGQESGAPPMGEEAKVANADKAFGKPVFYVQVIEDAAEQVA
jgi:hypothetical protein